MIPAIPDHRHLLILTAIAHWLAVSLYLSASGFFLHGLRSGRTRSLKIGFWLTAAGLLPHTLALGARWLAVGHGPYLQKDESLSVLAYGTISMFLLFSAKSTRLRGVGTVLLPGALVLMVAQLFLPAEIGIRPPATFNGIWFAIHVTSIIPAMGAFFIAISSAILYLWQERQPEQLSSKLPSLPVLDACNYKYAGFAFILWGIMIVAGAAWAEQSWGSYWSWDAIENWSLITWLLLGLLLHLRRFHGWQGKKAAWLMVACFSVSILTLFFLPVLTGSIHKEYLL
ncbi:MAG TPA: hypothetical protein ENK33_07590 [Desulfobacterales bacterium]|nr:hypothetical protein [Desulfobacterales bacterium]